MLEINEEHLRKFEEIKLKFFSKTKVPADNNWKLSTNDEIWLQLITQVMVVGNSGPADKFNKDTELKNQVAYEKLILIEDDELKIKINHVLRKVGTRYASSDISKCRKTNALVYNLKILKTFKDGLKDFLKRISEIEVQNADKEKVRFLINNFKYIKSKGARDFLMELGIVKNAIALDVRVQEILTKVGINIPKGFENNPKLYDEIEKDILTKICTPLGLLGVQFDRMLYQNYKEIMES